MATPVLKKPARRGLVLYGVDWGSYSRFLRAFAERPSVRLTYDRGVLEIMSPVLEHDVDGRFLGRLVIVLTEELGLPILSGGSTTFRRRRRKRGLEPDECFWIAHEPQVRGKRRINLRLDPPPDLTIEVDVTHSSLHRMGIYAALSVPEVWRLDGPNLTFEVLQPNGKYAPQPHSLAFSRLTPPDLLRFLGMRGHTDENALVGQFRAWVRQQIVVPNPPPP